MHLLKIFRILSKIRFSAVSIGLLFIFQESSWSGAQNFEILPMGLFRWISPAINGEQNTATTRSPLPTLLESIGRPMRDTAVPLGTDTAAIAAEEARIKSTIDSCKGQIEHAALKCPCARPGSPCADPLSLCNLENKCVCDGKLGLMDPTGTKCVAYATTTTTTRKSTTMPSTTTRTTTKATTTSTEPTIITTTTPTTTTTTPHPTIIYIPCIDGATSGDGFDIKFDEWYDVQSDAFPGGSTKENSCSGFFITAQSGKKIKIEFLEFNIGPDPPGPSCVDGDQSNSVGIEGAGRWCSANLPPSTPLIFDRDYVEMDFFVSPGTAPNGQPYRFRIRVSLVD